MTTKSMNRAELDAFLEEKGIKVDDGHFPHSGGNKFCDLYVGTGKKASELLPVVKELREKMVNEIGITTVDNSEHPDYGKQMIVIKSYWNE